MLAYVSTVLKKKAQIQASEAKVTASKALETKALENQKRLHEHLKNLEKLLQSNLCARYLKDLNKEEDDLAEVRKKIDVEEALQIQLKDELIKLQFQAGSFAGKLELELESRDLVIQGTEATI